MKSKDKLYLVNCGDYTNLIKETTPRKSAEVAVNEIFKDKNLNISTSLLVLDVKKCLRSLDLTHGLHIFSTEGILNQMGEKDLAFSVGLLKRELYG